MRTCQTYRTITMMNVLFALLELLRTYLCQRVFDKKERMEINSIKPVVIIDEAVCKYSCHSFIYISIGRAPKNNPMLGICLFYNIAVLFNNRATIKHIIDGLNVLKEINRKVKNLKNNSGAGLTYNVYRYFIILVIFRYVHVYFINVLTKFTEKVLYSI